MTDWITIKFTLLYLLIFAHFVADYLLQPAWLTRRKYERPIFVFVHGLIVFLVSFAAVSWFFDYRWVWGIVVISISHIAIDLMKIELEKTLKHRRLELGIADQLLHLALIALVWNVCIKRTKFGWGIDYISAKDLSNILLYLCGFLFIFEPVKSFVFGVLEKIHQDLVSAEYAKNIKKWQVFGSLERLIFFSLILIDKWLLVGFFVLARSLFHALNTDSELRREFFIIQIFSDVGLSIFAGVIVKFLVAGSI